MTEENKPSISVADLDALVEKLTEAYADEKVKSKAAKEAKAKVSSLEARMAAYLKELKRDNYQTTKGTFYMIRKWSVQVPKENADKLAFFDWCRERGIYEQYATVNSQSLNTLYKTKTEEAEAKGEFLSIPGIGAPTLFETTGFRKAK